MIKIFGACQEFFATSKAGFLYVGFYEHSIQAFIVINLPISMQKILFMNRKYESEIALQT